MKTNIRRPLEKNSLLVFFPTLVLMIFAVTLYIGIHNISISNIKDGAAIKTIYISTNDNLNTKQYKDFQDTLDEQKYKIELILWGVIVLIGVFTLLFSISVFDRSFSKEVKEDAIKEKSAEINRFNKNRVVSLSRKEVEKNIKVIKTDTKDFPIK